LNKKAVYPLLVFSAAVAVVAVILTTKPAPPADDYIRPATTVRTIIANKKAEYLIVRSQGTIEPRSESQLIPEVSGRVVWMSPALVTGGAFEKDAPLLRIDDADYNSAVKKSEAALTRSNIEREHAGDELARLQKLIGQNLASQSQVDEVQRRHRIADANLSEAKINLEQARRDLSRTEIHAPYSGLVRSEQVDLGQFVSRGTPIATIYADDFVEVRLPVASNQLSYLELSVDGQIPMDPPAPVSIQGELGNTQFFWHGALNRVEAEVDARSRMLYVVARFRNEPDKETPPLLVGLFVQAEIQGDLVDDIIRLPRSAIRDKDQVLVVDADSRLRFRQVTVLRIEDDEVLISSGLEQGESICVSPLQTVVDGMHVQAVEA
jgi:RND family efflux transporter MFP subunit